MTSRDRLLSARDAAARLADLLCAEQHAMADFLLALAAFDAARGWAELGHASLFAFLHRQLRLSKGAAFQRSVTAGLLQRHPAVAEALRRGDLCLSSVVELARVLAAGNEATVLPRFFGLSAREAREVAAELAPHPSPPAREVVRPLLALPKAGRVLTSELPVSATPREEAGSASDGDSRPPAEAAGPVHPVPIPTAAPISSQSPPASPTSASAGWPAP